MLSLVNVSRRCGTRPAHLITDAVDESGAACVSCCVKEIAALRSLLAKSIDYAGLFPPCSLELEPAIKNQAAYVRSAETWMLSTFVLPVSRFNEAAPFLDGFSSEYPIRVSALGPAEENSAKFKAALFSIVQEIRRCQSTHQGRAQVEQLEMALPKEGIDGPLIDSIASEVAVLKIKTFWEAPGAMAAKVIELLQKKATTDHLGFKLRTGGVKADAFPSTAAVAGALAAAVSHKVPIKFTAGLHHPVRKHRDEVGTKMHGFFNVLGAGVMTAEHDWNAEQCTAMLESEEPTDFQFTDDAFSWRDWSITTNRIEQFRTVITSFGSCSFNEPREDLQELHLLATTDETTWR